MWLLTKLDVIIIRVGSVKFTGTLGKLWEINIICKMIWIWQNFQKRSELFQNFWLQTVLLVFNNLAIIPYFKIFSNFLNFGQTSRKLSFARNLISYENIWKINKVFKNFDFSEILSSLNFGTFCSVMTPYWLMT